MEKGPFLEFTDPIKIYTHKDKGEVSISFMVTPRCVINDFMLIEHFQYICDNWRTGVEGLETDMGKIWWSHRRFGPRPVMDPADFVAISFKDWNFRITSEEMERLVDTFHYQLNNKNHWD